MSSSALISRVNRSLALAALVAFSALGLFGHSLHGLLPCSDGSCGVSIAESSDGCCCGHHHGPAAEETVAGAANESGSSVKSAGHDEANCSLCTLLAKIKVSHATFYHAELDVPHEYREPALSDLLISQDLLLSGAPRGPPAA
jgi:hypothetical protein